MLRGTGLQGLRAIPWKRSMPQQGWMVRPLLGCWRAELLGALLAWDVPYVDDPSNRDVKFVRNRVRHQLLPLLEQQFNPKVRVALVQLAEQSVVDYRFLDEEAARCWKRIARVESSGAVRLKVVTLRRQPEALQRQLVRRAIEQVVGDLHGLEFRHWREVEQLLCDRPDGAVVDLPHGCTLVRQGEWLTCRHDAARTIRDQPSPISTGIKLVS